MTNYQIIFEVGAPFSLFEWKNRSHRSLTLFSCVLDGFWKTNHWRKTVSVRKYAVGERGAAVGKKSSVLTSERWKWISAELVEPSVPELSAVRRKINMQHAGRFDSLSLSENVPLILFPEKTRRRRANASFGGELQEGIVDAVNRIHRRPSAANMWKRKKTCVRLKGSVSSKINSFLKL